MNDPREHLHVRRRPGAHFRLAMLIAATTLLAACGSQQQASLNLLPETTMVELLRGQTLQLSVTVSHSGPGAVGLAVSGAPTGVTAVFDDDSLPASGGQATLLISVAAGAPEGSATLTLSASSGSLTHSAQVDLEVDSLALAGRITGILDIGIADVEISSQGHTTVSASDGSFELGGLSVPYDLRLYYDDGGDGIVHVYQGLTGSSPTLRPMFTASLFPSLTPREASLSGDVLGGAPLPANHTVIVCAEGLSVVVYGCSSVDSPDDSYLLDLAWLGPEDTTVRVHAIRAQVNAGEIVAYHGYLTTEIDLSDGDALTLDLTVTSPVTVGSLQVEVVQESGASMGGGVVMLEVSPNLSIQLGQASVPVLEFLVPSGFSYTVVIEVDLGLAWRTGLGLDGGEILVPLSPAPLGPVDGAFNVGPTTPFQAFVPDGHSVSYLWSPDGPGPTVMLSTVLDGPVYLPDLSGTPASFPAGASYDWQVFSGLVPEGEIDNIPGYGDFFAALYPIFSSVGGPGPSEDGILLVSGVSRSFDLAP